MRKVLYSPGYGAGWSTWASGWAGNSVAKRLATDPVLVDLVERDEHTGRVTVDEAIEVGIPLIREDHNDGWVYEASIPFLKRCFEITEPDLPYCGGVHQLKVTTVSGPFRIEDYDGHESVIEPDQEEWW